MIIQGAQGPSYSVAKLDRGPLMVYFIHIRLYQEQVLQETEIILNSQQREAKKLQILKVL